MDETTTEDHRRYCPECQRWVEEAELRVRADGKPRHKVCDTATAPGAPVPSEMRELAGRMAADEAGEGNFAAAAALKAFADTPAPSSPLEQHYPGVQAQLAAAFEKAATTLEPVYRCARCIGEYPLIGGVFVDHPIPNGDGEERCSGSGTVPVPLKDGKPLPWNHPDADPLGDLAAFARAGREAGAAPDALPVVGPRLAERLANTGAIEGQDYVVSPPLEQRYPCHVCRIGEYPLVDGKLAEHDYAGIGRTGPCAGSGQVPRPLVIGTALEAIPAAGEGLVMLGGQPQALTTTASWRAALERDLDELEQRMPGVEITARMIAEELVKLGWVPGARRRAAELPKATAKIAGVPVPKIGHHITVAAEQVPEPVDPDRYEEQPIEDADGVVIGHVWELQPRYCLEHAHEWIAAVDGDSSNRPRFGSRDGAERWVRANALRDGRPLTVPYDAEKVLGLKSEVIGWVWLDPEHAGDDGRWLAVHGAAPEHQHPHWGSPAPGPDARNQAIGWVLVQDKEARRG